MSFCSNTDTKHTNPDADSCSCSHSHAGSDTHSPAHSHSPADTGAGGCGCAHSPSQGGWKKGLLRCLLAGALLVLALFLSPIVPFPAVFCFVPAYLVVGYDVLLHAGRGLVKGRVFNEHLLMSLATLGAFALGEAAEAVAVMLFYQAGELLSHHAEARSRRSITALMALRPENARVWREGEMRLVPPEKVIVGEFISVQPGERVPLDGIVTEGLAALDTAALTGESLPRSAAVGDEVQAGCLCLDGVLRLQVSRPAAQSAVARILELTEYAASHKAGRERFITRFAKIYTPVVVLLAVVLAVVPPLLMEGQGFSHWLYRALCFLVISCPCALVISVPLGFFAGIGGGARRGILFKGGNAMEALAKAELFAFDKTGTLTTGRLRVTELHPAMGSGEELLALTAKAEQGSNHPIAAALRDAASDVSAFGDDASPILRETAGMGVEAVVDSQTVRAGNAPWLAAAGIQFPLRDGTVVYTACDGVYRGAIVLEDSPRLEAVSAIAALRRAGVKKTVILSGDTETSVSSAATVLGIDEVHAALTPEGKLRHLEALLQRQNPRGTLVYVGDGINDAPCLSGADVGVAMGALGQDAAIEAADVVLTDDSLAGLATALRCAKRTRAIVTQNILFALAVKLVFMVLGIFGIATMWMAVFGDVGVTVLAIANALRALKVTAAKEGK